MCRTYLLLFLLVGMGMSLQAQRYQWRPQVHEISIEPLALRWVPAYSGNYSPTPFATHVPHAIRYAYNISYTHAVRLSVFRQRANFSNIETRRTETGLEAGYAYKMTNRKNQIQFGADAIVAQGVVRWDNPTILQAVQENNYQSFGVQAFTTLRHYFSQNVSLSGEAALGYLNHTYDTGVVPEAANEVAFSPSEVFVTGSIYLTVHFGKMKTKNCGCSH